MSIKHMNFLGGLPRSGSTLLATLLNQHPKVYASPHSALLEGLWNLRETFIRSEPIQYGLQWNASQKTLWNLPQLFYENIEKDVIVDKQFCWSTQENYELAAKISTYPRFIITYRPILEVLASFVSMAAKNPNFYLNRELESANFYGSKYLSKNDALAEYLMTEHGLMTKCILALANAKQNEKDGNFLFVAYNDLVSEPAQILNDVFEFLKVEPIEISIHNIANVFNYVDSHVLGVENFHLVRKEITKESTKPEDLFSEYILKKYSNALQPLGL